MALNRREKALLTLPVFLGGVMGFYNWVHEPLFARRAQALSRVDQVQSELKRDKARLDREGDLTARRSAVTTREQMVDSWVPGKNSAAMFIWYLSQAETYSGARVRNITVGERRQVAAAGQQEAKPDGATRAGQQAKPSDGSKTEAAAKPEARPGTSAKPPTDSPTVTVVRLDMNVDARFVEHLLFDQAIEQMPLFLNTDSFALVRSDKLPADRLSNLLASGDTTAAEQLLSSSPPVSGTYHINLYFKNGKPGPATNSMQFDESTGRMDPFIMAGVGDFVQSLVDYYATSTTDKPGLGRGRGDSPSTRSGQMG